MCFFKFNRTTLQVSVTYLTGALYVRLLWFYKHQLDNRVRSKLSVAWQRWRFQWPFWFVPSVPGYLREEEEHKPDPWRNPMGLHLENEVAVVKTPTIISNNPVCTSILTRNGARFWSQRVTANAKYMEYSWLSLAWPWPQHPVSITQAALFGAVTVQLARWIYKKIGLICVDLFIVTMTAVHSRLAGDSFTAVYNAVFIPVKSEWPSGVTF